MKVTIAAELAEDLVYLIRSKDLYEALGDEVCRRVIHHHLDLVQELPEQMVYQGSVHGLDAGLQLP